MRIFSRESFRRFNKQRGGDVLAPQTSSRSFLPGRTNPQSFRRTAGVRPRRGTLQSVSARRTYFIGEAEPQAIEPAARRPHLALEMLAGRRARFGHFPVAHQQVGRPAVIAHRFEDRIDAHREGLLRTLFDAIRAVTRKRVLGAVRPDATVVERANDGPIALGADVDPVPADLAQRPHDAQFDARRTLYLPISLRYRGGASAGPRETAVKSACERNSSPLCGSACRICSTVDIICVFQTVL